MSENKSTTTDPQLLLQRIKDNFPDVACETYSYIGEGWDHEVLIVDGKLVFRFPDDEEYTKLLKNEVTVLKRLKPFIKINIPEYMHISKDESFAGYPIIPGKPISRKVFDSLNAAECATIAAQLAGLLSTMHTLIANGQNFSDVALSDMSKWQQELKAKTEQHLKNKLSQADIAKVYEMIAKTDDVIKQPLPRVFLHGDIYNRHLLWDETTKELGVIDFSDMNRGDPAFDFAELYEYGEDFVNQVYGYYTGPKDETFLWRAWVYQQWIGVFMMVDYFDYHKTSFKVARETFDRVKNQQPKLRTAHLPAA